MLKPYHELDCPNQEIISAKVLEYLQPYLNSLPDKEVELWHKLNTIELVKAIPELVQWYKDLNLIIKECSITVVKQKKNVLLHIDELPVVAKINFPILNTAGSYNLWYHVPENILKEIPQVTNHFGNKFYDLGKVDLNFCDEIGRIELTKPIVFNSQLPHAVELGPLAKVPRVVLACTFFKEPINLLMS